MKKISAIFFTVLALIIFQFGNFAYVQAMTQDEFNRICLKGDVNEVKKALDEGASASARSSTGNTPLMVAAFQGNIPVAKLLLSRGAQINDINNADVRAINVWDKTKSYDENMKRDGWDALTLACQEGQFEMVKFLLANKAKVQGRTNTWSALMSASLGGYIEIVKFLVSKGAKVNEHDLDGNTALLIAAQKGHYSVVDYLLRHGAKINEKSKSGSTPLMDAVFNNQIEVVELLLKRGANQNLKNNEGVTALMIAQQQNNEEMIKILTKKTSKKKAKASK